jgi:GNAT superfamily N-acetyltransferase
MKTPVTIEYQPTRRRDLLAATRLIAETYNHLRSATGKQPIVRSLRKAHPLGVHLHKTDQGLSVCAWHGRKLVGYTQALVRGKQWYLAYLFVHPKYQDKKVGKNLLERVWRNAPGMSHGLATFAYNPQAVGIYSRFGMTIRETLPLMVSKPEQMRRPASTGLTVRSRLTAKDLAWIHALETRIRGYSHSEEWSFWLKQPNWRGSVYRDGGKRVGYCLGTRDGLFGPVGSISNRYLVRILKEHIAGLQLKKKQIARTFCPANNLEAYQTLLKCGFRVRELIVFMSDRRYGDFQRYFPADLAVF